MDSVERDLKAPEDPSLTVISTDTPTVVVAAEQQQSIEFDSPDSGLPSSRNYSVTSGILSSIDDGQSVCFEDGTEEEAGVDPRRLDSDHTSRTKGLEPQRSVNEEQPMDCKASVDESLSVCSAAYTVGCSNEVPVAHFDAQLMLEHQFCIGFNPW